MRRVHTDPRSCPQLTWSWRVERLQESADIRVKEKEDVAASIFFLFGDPGFLPNPKPVPTLRHVWTSDLTGVESVVDSPYLPGFVRSIVVRSGLSPAGWEVESRNILHDFEMAFGRPPKESVEAVALFTDNDQTQEPVVAYYEWARASCHSNPSR